jgi:hypothetical protein
LDTKPARHKISGSDVARGMIYNAIAEPAVNSAASSLIGAGGVALLWLIREIAGRVISQIAARGGKSGYAYRKCGFFLIAKTEDGRTLESQFDPANMFLDQEILPLICVGDLYNDSDTALLLEDANVDFIGADGPHVRKHSAEVVIDGHVASVIAVPAHGRCGISMTLRLLREDLDRLYADTIPILRVRTVTGKPLWFPLSSVSFYGKNLVGWPRKGALPIRLLHRHPV